MNEMIPLAHLRLSQLQISMIEAAESRDKQQFLELLRSYEEDYDSFVDLLSQEIGLSDEDIKSLMSPVQESELLTQAAASQAGFRLPTVLAETPTGNEPKAGLE